MIYNSIIAHLFKLLDHHSDSKFKDVIFPNLISYIKLLGKRKLIKRFKQFFHVYISTLKIKIICYDKVGAFI